MPPIEYAVARVRGLRGRLLGLRGAAELAAQPNLAARLALLKQTDYADVVPPGEPSARDVARRLRRRLVRDAAWIQALLEGRARTLFAAVAAIGDAWLLKTVLRGVDRRELATRLLAMLEPSLELDQAALHELVAQPNVKGVVDLLTTWRSPYAAPLAAAMPAYARDRDLVPLELALDRFVFGRALAAARRGGENGRIVRRFVRRAIGLANAAVLLRAGGKGVAPELLIPGGDTVRLGDGAVGPFLRDRLLQRRLREALVGEARTHPLSLAVPLLYLLDREEDIRRIRLVLEGTEVGIEAGELGALVEAVA